MAAPSILLVGGTGNIGQPAVKTLSEALSTSSTPILSKAGAVVSRIIVISRDAKSTSSASLTKLPHVEVVEKLWTDIDADWLREQNVVRAFMTSPPLPSQFWDETCFAVACKTAKVEYLIKISTNGAGLTADSPPNYIRAHWATEQVLKAPEFAALPSTIIRPNAFIPTVLAGFVMEAKAKYAAVTNSEDGPLLQVNFGKDTPMALVDPLDIGTTVGKLLALPDPSAHFGRTYHLSGPSDITGQLLTALVEAKLGKKLKVEYEVDNFEQIFVGYPTQVIEQMKASCSLTLRSGLSGLSTKGSIVQTSPELIALGIPRTSVQDFVDSMFA